MTEETLPLKELKIESGQIKEAALIFTVINNKTRQRILNLLQENKRMNVSSIYGQLGLVQAVTSVHLSILRRVGVVCTKREDRFVYYSVNYKRLGEISEAGRQFLRF